MSFVSMLSADTDLPFLIMVAEESMLFTLIQFVPTVYGPFRSSPEWMI